ncbi:hypothetical protein [Euzebyella saccharophila]|uniref:Lipoprotein n=1 Tax=Euzebyella saccharophila TaxID=679664 RepID=A0ABV8JPA8_9FLAO|nr:hypothetical protein [Euzebyella saccharophila]
MKAKGLSRFLALIVLCISFYSCTGEEEVFANCVLYQDCPEEEENAINPEEGPIIAEKQ